MELREVGTGEGWGVGGREEVEACIDGPSRRGRSPMEAQLPASASASDSGQASPSWSSSTNWTVRRGSLHDAICFETSATFLEDVGVDQDGAVPVSKGALLEKPAGHESAPCEITVYFREKHEIHRIYVQSTARVYEIYYASQHQVRSNEYLCTVRCGAAEKVYPSSHDCEDAVMHPSHRGSNMTKDEGNPSNEEDGWIEVNPDSPMVGDVNDAFSNRKDGLVEANNQIYYEATAEISDASPCASITLRLLSLQSNECVHIEEVYIYADPVESTDLGSPQSTGGSINGNSLLTMLLPSMLQLSKFSSSGTEDKIVAPRTVPHERTDASCISGEMDPKVMSSKKRKALLCSIENEQVSAPIMPHETGMPSDLKKEETRSHNVPESVPEKDNATYGYIGRTLDELVLRVGKLEALFERFEDNMLKPLGCIDTRLQRVEQQLDELSSRPTPSKPLNYSRISAPDFCLGDCDSDGGFDIPDTIKEDITVDSLEVKGDGFVGSPKMVEDVTTEVQGMVKDASDGSKTLPADKSTSILAPDVCAGLSIKAPEFMNEEDEHVCSNDISESAALPFPKAKKPLSIDDALTSALEAFVLSSTDVSKNDTTPVQSQSSSVDTDARRSDENVATCEAAELSGTVYPEISHLWSGNIASYEGITFKEDGELSACRDKQPRGSLRDFAIEEISGNCFMGSVEAFRIDDDDNNDSNVNRKGTIDDDSNNLNRKGTIDDDTSDIDEAPSEVFNLTRDFRKWDQGSDPDSNHSNLITEDRHNVDWPGYCTDSDNEPYTLHDWLSGCQNDLHKSTETSFSDGTSIDASDYTAMRCNIPRSKAEIQKALESLYIGEPRVNIQEDLGLPKKDEPSLLDVQFVRCDEPNYAFQVDALMKGVVDSEVWGNNRLNDGEEQRRGSSLLETSRPDAAVQDDDRLLIDLEVATVQCDDFRMNRSDTQPTFSSLI